jgi:hypothetical protein
MLFHTQGRLETDLVSAGATLRTWIRTERYGKRGRALLIGGAIVRQEQYLKMMGGMLRTVESMLKTSAAPKASHQKRWDLRGWVLGTGEEITSPSARWPASHSFISRTYTLL